MESRKYRQATEAELNDKNIVKYRYCGNGHYTADGEETFSLYDRNNLERCSHSDCGFVLGGNPDLVCIPEPSINESKEGSVINGTFEFVNGKLNFTCHTEDASFDEVKTAITKLRDECQRQIDNETNCPFHLVSETQSSEEKPINVDVEDVINSLNTPEGLDQYSYDEGFRAGANWQSQQPNTISKERLSELYDEAYKDGLAGYPMSSEKFKYLKEIALSDIQIPKSNTVLNEATEAIISALCHDGWAHEDGTPKPLIRPENMQPDWVTKSFDFLSKHKLQ